MSGAQEHAHDHDDSKCRRYLGNLSEYYDGTLSPELCDEIEIHMATCDNCRVVINTFAKTVSLYQQLPGPEMPVDVKERLFKVLDLSPFLGPETSDQP